jgi:hypothetical protein
LLGGGAKSAPDPLPEAQIATLQEAFTAYSAPCPFKPGDIVTPRATATYRDRGKPHVVLEVLNTPICNFEPSSVEGGVFSGGFGNRLDIRVAVLKDGIVATFWNESWQHELYTGQDQAAAVEETEPSQPQVKAKAGDEWVEWTGGACPVDLATPVEIEVSGKNTIRGDAGIFEWRHLGFPGDILRYRTIKH